jgi:predicted dithiol-disulfide oxidoreductase (DUF899 family)
MNAETKTHPAVSREEWLGARKRLLQKEKQLTRMRDDVSRQRRELPWVKVEDYIFDGPNGKVSLTDLFDRRTQLAVYHFMLTPGSDHICDGCAFMADHVDSARMHFEQNDLSFAAISRAPIGQIQPVQKRMGWRFRWVSSFQNQFNYDFHVSFTEEQIRTGSSSYNFGTSNYASPDLPGISIFIQQGGEIFHTYSSYARGGDLLLGAYNWLDLAPKGRNETEIMDWVRLHDEYEDSRPVQIHGALKS